MCILYSENQTGHRQLIFQSMSKVIAGEDTLRCRLFLSFKNNKTITVAIEAHKLIEVTSLNQISITSCVD